MQNAPLHQLVSHRVEERLVLLLAQTQIAGTCDFVLKVSDLVLIKKALEDP
jgi:hypothetical protein